ncbi:hypothetical protein [Streptomyces sp. NBC_00455]|uniref:hypothetical protein n=1 Tax=Streptomyces sp. NBC_00455 TaxID=2903654 RepID=UPI002E202563
MLIIGAARRRQSRPQREERDSQLDRCKANFANIARIDTHAHQLHSAAADLGRQITSGLVPEPLADRLRERAPSLQVTVLTGLFRNI